MYGKGSGYFAFKLQVISFLGPFFPYFLCFFKPEELRKTHLSPETFGRIKLQEAQDIFKKILFLLVFHYAELANIKQNVDCELLHILQLPSLINVLIKCICNYTKITIINKLINQTHANIPHLQSTGTYTKLCNKCINLTPQFPSSPLAYGWRPCHH